MIFPKNFEQKIGFDLVRDALKNHCISDTGLAYVNRIAFCTQFSTIEKLVGQTEEFRQILLSGTTFPLSDFADISEELNMLKLEGTCIDLNTLFELKITLQVYAECAAFLNKKTEEELPEIKKLFSEFNYDPVILKPLSLLIDDKGAVKDDASPELKRIRKELLHKQNSASKKIILLLQKSKKEGWISADAELTIRNGRLVIPVSVTHKRKIRGFIHDESATGQTVFIEPDEVFDANNEIRELENDEKREIHKILLDFTKLLRYEIPCILSCIQFLGIIDFIRAKALFALDCVSSKPKLINYPVVEWFNARHPHLYLSHKAQGKSVVPMSLTLNSEKRILVISGPNAGGKSVCLKTVGLLQYMLQCGLLVSMDDQSQMGIFNEIFINIGDEQSIEDDLSTYSSHLLAMKTMIFNAGENSLFLIDEFGSGTEPRIGGAIAEAVLENLNNKLAFGLITTHYANLKTFAANTKGIFNGAMMFDTKKLQPLYKLTTGNPGSSFAFEIAEKTGFPKRVIDLAHSKTDEKELDLEKQLQDLEVQREFLKKKEQELNNADNFLSEMIDKYQKLNEKLDIQKKEIIEKAKKQAEEILSKSNSIIEKTIKEIRENNADKTKTIQVRNELKKFSDQLLQNESKPQTIKKIHTGQVAAKKVFTKKPKILHTPIDKGDFVRISGQTAVGEVLSCDNKDVLILFGSSKIKTTLSNLEKVDRRPDIADSQRLYQSNFSLKLEEKLSKFKTTIDIRGFKAEEALSTISKYIDEAQLLSIQEVRILHGKGNGVLRNVIRDFLRTVKEIKRIRDESLENGGHGITVVSFN